MYARTGVLGWFLILSIDLLSSRTSPTRVEGLPLENVPSSLAFNKLGFSDVNYQFYDGSNITARSSRRRYLISNPAFALPSRGDLWVASSTKDLELVHYRNETPSFCVESDLNGHSNIDAELSESDYVNVGFKFTDRASFGSAAAVNRNGFHRVSSIKNTPMDIGDSSDNSWDHTVTFGLKIQNSSKGVLFTVSDHFAVGTTKPAPIGDITELLRIVDSYSVRTLTQTPIPPYSVSLNFTAFGMYLDGPGRRLLYFISAPSQSFFSGTVLDPLDGQFTFNIVLQLEEGVFDNEWHHYAAKFEKVYNNHWVTLVVDGKNGDEVCTRERYTEAKPLPNDPQDFYPVPSNFNRLFSDGVLVVGDISASSLFAFQIHPRLLDSREVVALGAQWMFTNLPISKRGALIFGLVLVCFAFVFIVSTLIQAFHEMHLGDWLRVHMGIGASTPGTSGEPTKDGTTVSAAPIVTSGGDEANAGKSSNATVLEVPRWHKGDPNDDGILDEDDDDDSDEDEEDEEEDDEAAFGGDKLPNTAPEAPHYIPNPPLAASAGSKSSGTLSPPKKAPPAIPLQHPPSGHPTGSKLPARGLFNRTEFELRKRKKRHGVGGAINFDEGDEIIEKHDVHIAETVTPDDQTATLSQQMAEMLPFIVSVIQAQGLYLSAWEWPFDFKNPFQYIYWPISLEWLWATLDTTQILILQLVVCLFCGFLSVRFVKADEKTFRAGARRCRVAMEAYFDCVLLIIDNTVERLIPAHSDYTYIAEDARADWANQIVSMWKIIRRQDLQTIPTLCHYPDLITELLGVLPKPPEDALEAYVLRYTLKRRFVIDPTGIAGVCSGIKSGVPLDIVFRTNCDMELSQSQLDRLQRTIMDLTHRLMDDSEQSVPTAEADTQNPAERRRALGSPHEAALELPEDAPPSLEEMQTISKHEEEGNEDAKNDDGDIDVDRRNEEYRDELVEQVNKALVTDLPQPPLNGRAPKPQYEIVLVRMGDGASFVVCDDQKSSEEDSLVRSVNEMLRHPEAMEGHRIEELEVWRKDDYQKARRMQRIEARLKKMCCLNCLARFAQYLAPPRSTLYNVTPYKDVQGGYAYLSCSDHHANKFVLRMNDECPAVCPEHGTYLVAAAEDRHYSVRTVEGHVPYTCAHENAFAMKTTRSKDWRRVLPCRNGELLVCSNDRCCFAVCVACAKLGWYQRVRARFCTIIYLVRHMKTNFLPLIILVLLQSLLLPITLNCIRMVSCSREVRCEFPHCYDNPPTGFIVSIVAAYLLFFVFRVGLAGFWLFTLLRRRRHLRMMSGEGLKSNLEWWKWFLREDRSVLGNLYRKYEFQWIVLDPIMNLLYQVGVSAAASMTEPNSTQQMVAVGTIELISGLFLALSNPFIDPWLDLLAKLGNTHQLLQLGFSAFDRYLDARALQGAIRPMSILMIVTASLYFTLVLFIIYKTVVSPWKKSRETVRAAGVVRRERIFVDEPDVGRSVAQLTKLKLEKMDYYGKEHFQVLLTRANLLIKNEYLKSVREQGMVPAPPLEEASDGLDFLGCCRGGGSTKADDGEDSRHQLCADFVSYLERLLRTANTGRTNVGSGPALSFDRQRLRDLGASSRRNLVECLTEERETICHLLLQLVLSTRADRTMKIAGANAFELLVELKKEIFQNLDLRKISIPFALAEDVHFMECSLRGANLTGVSFLNSVFVRSDLSKATYISTKFGRRSDSTAPRRVLIDPVESELRPIQKCPNTITSVSLSPVGKEAVCCGTDGVIRVWDTVTGQLKLSVPSHIAALPGFDSSQFSWPAYLRSLVPPTPPNATAVRGRTLASPWGGPSSANDGEMIQQNAYLRWSEELQCPLPGNGRTAPFALFSVAISPCGSKIACGGESTVAVLWDWDGAALHNPTSFVGHSNSITAVLFSPNGKRLVTASLDCSVKIWSLEAGIEIQSFLHSSGVISCDCSIQFSLVATGCQDGVLSVWCPDTGNALIQSQAVHTQVKAIAFSPDGVHMASGGPRSLCLWNCREWKTDRLKIWKSANRDANVLSVAFSADGTRLASGCDDSWLYFWAVESREPLSRLRLSGFSSIAFSMDGLRLATANENKLCVWAAPTRQYRSKTLFSARVIASGVAIHPKADRVVAGTIDGILDFYDLNTGVWLMNDENHERQNFNVKFSSDGRFLVSSDEVLSTRDRDWLGVKANVVVRDNNCKNKLWKLTAASFDVYFTISPDAELLLIATNKHLWVYTLDKLVASGRSEKTAAMDLFVGLDERITAAAFAKDSKRVVVGLSTGKLVVTSVVGSQFTDLRPLGGHSTGAVTAVECSPTEFLAVTAGEDFSIRVWSIEPLWEMKQIASVLCTSIVKSLSINKTGTFVAAGGNDGRMSLYRVEKLTCTYFVDLRVYGKDDYVGVGSRVSVEFSQSADNYLVSAEKSGVRLWDIDRETGMALIGREAGTAKTFEEFQGVKSSRQRRTGSTSSYRGIGDFRHHSIGDTSSVSRTILADPSTCYIWSSNDPLLFRDCVQLKAEKKHGGGLVQARREGPHQPRTDSLAHDSVQFLPKEQRPAKPMSAAVEVPQSPPPRPLTVPTSDMRRVRIAEPEGPKPPSALRNQASPDRRPFDRDTRNTAFQLPSGPDPEPEPIVFMQRESNASPHSRYQKRKSIAPGL